MIKLLAIILILFSAGYIVSAGAFVLYKDWLSAAYCCSVAVVFFAVGFGMVKNKKWAKLGGIFLFFVSLLISSYQYFINGDQTAVPLRITIMIFEISSLIILAADYKIKVIRKDG